MELHGKAAASRQSDHRPQRCLGAMGGNHSSGAHTLAHVKMSILHSKTRAAAIMLALWALFLLSAMIISWALDIDSRLTISGSANRLLEAEAMACPGVEVAFAL